MGISLLNLGDQPGLGSDEDVHGGDVVGGSLAVADDVDDLAGVVQLQGQVNVLLAVADAGLGDDGDILAGSDVGSDDGTHVDVGDDGGVDHDNVLVIAELQEVHSGVQGVQLAAVDILSGLCVGGQELQTALTQLQAPLLAGTDVVHQGLIAVTGDDADVTDTGAGQVGQSKVDLAITCAKGQGCHGALLSQHAGGGIVGENDTHYVHSGDPPIIL